MLEFVTNLRDTDYLSGALILVDKPQGWTSFDVVNKIRGILRHKYGIKKIKVGHSGTLDPMATGLLLICTGKWTKELFHLTGLDKKYDGRITLGVETDSYDAEGKVVSTAEVPALTTEEIQSHLNRFLGDIEQFPPAFSAIKKEGTPLYALARAGKEVKTEARKVHVHSITLKAYEAPVIDFTVHCGSGFYVRSLAHDLGAWIGCGAHLSGLVRTSVGEYDLKNAISVGEFRSILE
jgi:tRNA pseudouridine55 synthase